ncbi:BatA and WFA domain-containing protein [bacterium]|nr:BatA and WFA domain-containing protein [bacterium]
MLGFINTSILIGLIGISIPLLIHLLARQKVKKVYFSSLAFIRQIQKQHFRRIRIRQILLLIIRCLVVLFIVMAFARPTLKTGNLFLGKSRVTAVIAMDQSMSMARGDVWTRAQTAAKQIARILNNSGDQVAVIGHSKTKASFWPAQYSKLLEKIQNAMPQYTAQSAELLLEAADNILTSAEFNRELYWITDLQATAFSDTVDSSLHFSSIDHCYVMPVQEKISNIALTDAGIENQIISPGGVLRVFAQIENYSDKPFDAVLVRLSMNQASVAQKMVDLPPGGKQRVIFSVTPRESGWIDGEIKLEDDEFLPDNTRYFSIFIPSRIHILILGNKGQDFLPIRFALNPEHQRKNFVISERYYGMDWTEYLNQTDVVYAVNYPLFNEMEIQAIKQFLNRGGGFILIPGSETNLRQLNDGLFKIYGLVFGNLISSEKADGYRSFGQIDYLHPVFERIFEKNHEQIRSPQFWQSIEVVNAGSSQILIRFKDGGPFLLILPYERGNFILMTSGISPPWSDFQTLPFFAPLIHRLALYGAMTFIREESQVCGKPIHYILKSVPDDNIPYSVKLPSGDINKVLPEKAGRQIRLSLKTTDMPGIYRFLKNDSILTAKAVNINPAESDFQPIGYETLKAKLSDFPVSIISEQTSLEAAVRHTRWGREIAWEMLLIAMVLLLAELFLARTRTHDSK